jgi:uncharacterized glyoxalase superfamily protein PhnB
MSTPNAALSVQPYLFFGGRCAEALEFYRSAVGAEVQMMMRYGESPEPHGLPECFADKVMHASVRIGETTLMASRFPLTCLTNLRLSGSSTRWRMAGS